MSAPDLVREGEKHGHIFTPSLVYMVRSNVRKASGAPPRKRGRPRKTAQPAPSSTTMKKRRGRPAKPSGLSDLEKTLAEALLVIGLPRVKALIAQLEKALG